MPVQGGLVQPVTVPERGHALFLQHIRLPINEVPYGRPTFAPESEGEGNDTRNSKEH